MGNIENKNKKRKFLPLRLNLLFLVVFMLFGILIIRLGFVQIVNGKYFRAESELTKTIEASVQTERGKMFDRNGTLLVSNEPSFALTYIRVQGTTVEDHMAYAKKIIPLIHMPTDKITKRDLKDFWIAKKGLNEAYKLKFSGIELSSETKEKDKYGILLDRITDSDLASIENNAKEMEILAVKRELDSATNLDVTFVKKGLTTKEVALIGEHLGELGSRFSISSTSNRVYPNGDAFYYGSLGPIPAEQINQYLLRGYSRNNEVGVSYLENQYEGVLVGKEKTYTFTTTKSGKPIGSPKVTMGNRGHDLVLSIDSRLQKKIGEILQRKITQARTQGQGPVTSAYVVMMQPDTGEVLAMVGRKLTGGTFRDVSYQTLQSAFEVGSTVKGATILALHQMTDSIPQINDMTIKLPGAPDFSSYTSGIGAVNDIHALEQSSNVYMGRSIGQVAGFYFAHAGGSYQATVYNGKRFQRTFQKLRDVYSQVGLGVKTGIDLPGEALGYEGRIPINSPGSLLYYTIGQYDTYTPIQLAQYVSTIANGGYRVQPHLLKEIRKATGTEELGPLISKYRTNYFNKIENTETELKRVQQGFYLVTHGGRGTAKALSDTEIAGKTGTAQIDGPGNYNLTFIGYAPYENPEIAFAIVVPNINDGHVNVEIADEIVKAYNEN